MSERAPDDQAVFDRHPDIAQDGLYDAFDAYRCPRCGVPVEVENHPPEVCSGPI